jgi:hypothetical protein
LPLATPQLVIRTEKALSIQTRPPYQTENLIDRCLLFVPLIVSDYIFAKMTLQKVFKPFSKNYKFQTIKSQTYDNTDIESEEPLIKGGLVWKPAVSNAWIYLTIANLVILSITVYLLLHTKLLGVTEKNAVLRPVSWWCKYSPRSFLTV